MQGGQCLLDGRAGVVAVDLIEVHVVGSQPLEAGIDGRAHVLAAQAPVVGALPHRVEDLRGQHDVLAVALEGRADDLLASSARVHVGRVDEVDTQLEGALDDRDGLLLLDDPLPPIGRAKAHRSQADLTDARARRA